MRHVIFAVLVCLFVLQGGQNWHVYSAALLIAAWVKHKGNLGSHIGGS